MATRAELIQNLRIMLGDDSPEKNILNGYEQKYTDGQLSFFLDFALKDINNASPATNYLLEEFPEETLLITGAMIFSQIASGLLQMDNQLDYNDAGFSLSMFNKTGMKQGWASFLLQMYATGLQDFKRTVIGDSFGSGFVGLRSNFSRDWYA